MKDFDFFIFFRDSYFIITILKKWKCSIYFPTAWESTEPKSRCCALLTTHATFPALSDAPNMGINVPRFVRDSLKSVCQQKLMFRKKSRFLISYSAARHGCGFLPQLYCKLLHKKKVHSKSSFLLMTTNLQIGIWIFFFTIQQCVYNSKSMRKKVGWFAPCKYGY